jgi:hypothetical protein
MKPVRNLDCTDLSLGAREGVAIVVLGVRTHKSRR